MKIEITKPEVLSTTADTYKEIAAGVYQRDRDCATLIIAGDGQRAVIVNPGTCGTD